MTWVWAIMILVAVCVGALEGIGIELSYEDDEFAVSCSLFMGGLTFLGELAVGLIVGFI